MITLSIDVKLLDKARFKPFKRRDGTEALFAELIMIDTPSGAYGDFIVKQSITKEERQAGKQLPILGNAKYQDSKPAPAPKQVGTEAEAFQPGDPTIPEGDVPF